MGLISYLQKCARGETDRQIQNRYQRANRRFLEYEEVVQWYMENADEAPLVIQDYTALSQMAFRPGHDAVLLGYRNDIERKLAHALIVTPGVNPWISGFRRPGDATIYCVYVLLRDRQQQFALIKGYWFLAAGETERGFRRPVIEGIIRRN